jgi:hydrogenase expression/formation protein HypD
MESKSLNIDGLLCPGHVSVIIGSSAYGPVAERFGVPCVVAGFEAGDILLGILMLIRQIQSGPARVENAYGRAVTGQGNIRALKVMYDVFEPADACWRGLGAIAGSGLRLRNGYGNFDAKKRFGIMEREAPEPKGCGCGKVLTGCITPPDCPLYKTVCTPEQPVGPCMVSSEGTCAAYYKYVDSPAKLGQ